MKFICTSTVFKRFRSAIMNTIHHPKTIINNRTAVKKFSDDQLVHIGAVYLQEQASLQPKCICISKRTEKSCDCLRIFGHLSYDYCLTVSRYMVKFAKRPKPDQQMTVMEWIRYSGFLEGRTGRLFIIPQWKTQDDVNRFYDDTPDDRALQLGYICNSALMTILGYGQTFWNTVMRHSREGTTPEHGLVGRIPWNSISETMQMELHLFFAHIEDHAEPTAMRFIREKTGTTHERDTKDIKWLPPYFSKRSLYRRYCFEQGWVTSTDCKGSPNKKTERKDDPWTLLQQERGDVCSWKTFLHFWRNNYSYIAVGKPSEDVCNACHKYCNQLKYNNMKAKEDSNDAEGDSDDEDFNEDELNDRDSEDKPTEKPSDTPFSVLTVPPDVESTEEIIMNAEQHVKDAKAMREYANMKMKKARESKGRDEWSSSKDCLVADYCQNMALPHQGMTQPGETYYFSPLTINCFGTADAGFENPQMRAYVYDEGVGKKGGNNVASLLYRDIHERGWIDKEKGPREELTVIMDNCAGQNKNKMVIRMFALLAETGAYKKINIAFLVAGHTKNVCDRLFNILKMTYRKTNVYTFEQLVGVLNTAQDVAPTPATKDDFKNWEALEDKIYKNIISGTVHKTHLFELTSCDPGILVTKDTASPDSVLRRQDLRKNMKAEERATVVGDYEKHLEALEPPGIKPIKQYELWHKWRPYIPLEYQDILCPKPSQEVIDDIKKSNNERSKKAAGKRRDAKRQKKDKQDGNDQLSEGTSVGQRVTTIQTPETERDDVTLPNPKILDSIRLKLNPSSPS